MRKRVAVAMVVALAVGAAASAQTSGRRVRATGQASLRGRPRSRLPQSTVRRRAITGPATTTPSGDTGLWFVPTGEVLPAKRWSVSAYRVNFDHPRASRTYRTGR